MGNKRELLNLSYGNADFLYPYWRASNATCSALSQSWSMPYMRDEGRPELIEQIRELHDAVGNCEHKDKYIVLGHGIRHLLAAALHAQARATERVKVYANPPHFFLFEDIVFNMGLEFNNGPASDELGGYNPEKMLNIITSPSNPVNLRGQGERGPINVWDLCYNWTQYGDVGCFTNLPAHDVQIFGLAKATGHAGTRLAWAFTEDKDIADMMREFIHVSTGGVSYEAQARAEDLLLDQALRRKEGEEMVFDWGRRVLDSRWTEMHHAGLMTEGHKSGLHIVNCSGMFAWAKLAGERALLTAAKDFESRFDAKVLPGEMCYPDAYDMLRINIGCGEGAFQSLMERLQAAK